MGKSTGIGQLGLLEIGQRDSILHGLYARGGVFKKAIDEEVQKRLSVVTPTDVAHDLIFSLSEVDDEMAYANSGRGSWGYRSYEETVSELIRDQFDPIYDRIEKAASEGRPDLSLITVEGIVLGLYRYERECRYNYTDAIPDDWIMMAEEAVLAWKELYRDDEESWVALMAFIETNCPDWENIF